MKRLVILLLVFCLMLSGCANILAGSYYHTEPHEDHSGQEGNTVVNVENYTQLYNALANAIEGGVQSRVVSITNYGGRTIEQDIRRARTRIKWDHPIAAYAVEDITYEFGTSGGQSAIAFTITYSRDRNELRKIREVWDVADGRQVIAAALDSCEAGVVIYMKRYTDTDFVQFVEDYGERNPQKVMETPQVTVNCYPDSGDQRVIEIKFDYQNSREDLRNMQDQVSSVFASAVLYVSGDGAQQEKFSQLYSFLMERYEYQVKTSITPAYSLLRHGVGDSRAFATVYNAMCAEAGLECRVVTGTRWGEPWSWNMVCIDGSYYHLDLLQSNSEGAFRICKDVQMGDYVWDYSAYPQCVSPEPEVTEPSQPVGSTPEEQPTQPATADES